MKKHLRGTETEAAHKRRMAARRWKQTIALATWTPKANTDRSKYKADGTLKKGN